VPGVERGKVRIPYDFLFRKLLVDPVFDRFEVTIEHPHQESERPEVFATAAVALREPVWFDRFQVEVADVDRHELESIQLTGIAWIFLVARFRQVARGKGVVVDDDQCAGFE
jgi:hypothetical protein